jgi:hypothetical protein
LTELVFVSKGQSIVYTPITWIRQLASDAAKEYRPFTIADVREDDKAPVLRVVVCSSCVGCT